MMYRHRQYGIVWKMLNKERTKCVLVYSGTRFSKNDIGRVLENYKTPHHWDNVKDWVPYGFSEYIKLLN